MLEKDALTTVVDILKPESFYKDQHQEIYSAIQELFKNSEPIDMLTVTNQLRKDAKLEFVGGAYYYRWFLLIYSIRLNLNVVLL